MMSRATSQNPAWLGLLLLVVLSPLIAVVLLLWLIAAIILSVLAWLVWCTRGRDILFVYSDSPIWHNYIDERILPRIAERSIIVNWSERQHWLDRYSLRALAFRFFGGSHEYNPLALCFRPFRPHRTFRFWQAFKDWKHGKTERLKKLEDEFFRCIGEGNTNESDDGSPRLEFD